MSAEYNSNKKTNTIVSLTVRDEKNRILVGVRKPETNLTHPNVLSTPTQRFPFVLLDKILNNVELEKIDLKELSFPEQIYSAHKTINPHKVDNRKEGGSNPLIYIVESLLNTKLGMAHFLERGETWFVASPTSLLQGELLYENDVPQIITEKIIIDSKPVFKELATMLGIAVQLYGNCNIPSETASYSTLNWITENEFKEMVKNRSILNLSKLFGDDSVNYCVKGMCLMSTYTTFK